MFREDVSILVVDDVNTMRVQIKDLLKQFGFRKILVAADGEEAKKLLGEHSFQLVLADWHMSPLDGLGLLRFMRHEPKFKDIAFIMITAESTKERVMEAIKAGVDDYLIKPLTPMQVENKIFGVLLRKQVLA